MTPAALSKPLPLVALRRPRAKTLQIGERFGRWVVIGDPQRHPLNKLWSHLCRCECGTESVVPVTILVRGRSTRCVLCFRKDGSKSVKHGHCVGGKDSPEMTSWRSMLDRCYRETADEFPNYGGRGIKVCARWQLSFIAFLEDMGTRPSPKHSLDRINVNGHYEPENCRWATRAEQAANQRTNVRLTLNGRTQHSAAWCRELGISAGTLSRRLSEGWTTEEALLTPPLSKNGKGKAA